MPEQKLSIVDNFNCLAANPLKALCILTTLSFGLAGCETPRVQKSEAQRAYEACVKTYNDKAGTLRGEWAFVSSPNGTCFYSYNAANASDTVSRSLKECREDTGGRCFTFADSKSGLSEFAARISAKGGSDGSGRRASRNDFSDGLAVFGLGMGLVGAITGNDTLSAAGIGVASGAAGSSYGARSASGEGSGASNTSDCAALRQQRDEARKEYNRLVRSGVRGDAEAYFLPVIQNAENAMKAIGC